MNSSVAYGDYQINCQVVGSGEVLVFLHGWPTNSRLWEAQVQALQSNFKIITFDWLGFGQSDKPLDHHYTFTNKKDILHTVLSQLLKEDEPINLIAHDIGGPAAILWASENPRRVKRLILLNTVVFPFKTKLDRLSHVLFQLPIVKDILASTFGLSRIMKTNTKSGNRAVEERIKNILSVYAGVDKKLRLKTILDPLDEGGKNEFHQLSKLYAALSTDKYFIIAKKDPLCYAHIHQLSMENPEVPVFPILKCGHYIPIDQAQALTDILWRILSEKK